MSEPRGDDSSKYSSLITPADDTTLEKRIKTDVLTDAVRCIRIKVVPLWKQIGILPDP